MSFKEDWNQTSIKEHWSWIIQNILIIIFGAGGIWLALLFANSSPRNYSLLIPTSVLVFLMILTSKIPWREPTNKTGSEDK